MIKDFQHNFINGIRFHEICDYILTLGRMDNILPSDRTQIVFVKAEYWDIAFSQIEKYDSKFILISHCSDHSVTREIFERRPSNIVKWYAQNVNYKHADLIPLPLALENHEGPCAGTTDYGYLFDTIKPLKISNKITNKIYCGFNCSTNKNRSSILNTLHLNGHYTQTNRLPNYAYFEQMKNFLFVASPPGSGIDCHRTWEALYGGCIPIVEKHFMYDTYTLPIIQVDDWNILPETLKPYIDLYSIGDAFKFTEQLDINYWFKLILNERKIHD